MKSKKILGQPLSDQEMKGIKGGYVFPVYESNGRCPLCGKEVELTIRSYNIRCEYCGGVFPVKEKED